MMFTLNCIKCSAPYGSKDDPDPYYCESCKKVRDEVAKKVNAMVASRPRKNRKSALQEYDAAQKIRGFVFTKL